MEALKKENKTLKWKLKMAEGGRKAGWASFYRCENERYDLALKNIKLLKELEKNEGDLQLPNHIVSEIKELYEETRKCVECPITLEIIPKDMIVFSNCGHIYHRDSYAKLCAMDDAKCAICRRKVYPKKE